MAEADAARLRAAKLEVSDLVCRNHNLAALVICQDKDGAVGNRGGQGALYLLEGGFSVHDELSWHGLNSDLDFHVTPLAPGRNSVHIRCACGVRCPSFNESGQHATEATGPLLRLARRQAAHTS